MPISLDRYKSNRSSMVALGTFDGVHRGHQALLRQAAGGTQADEVSLALAFSRPPGNYLGSPKPMLLPAEKKYQLIEKIVDQAVFAEFPALVSMKPETFVAQVLCGRLGARGVVVGQDYRFGRHRAGDVALLKRLGQRHGFEVLVVEAVIWDNQAVSSTRIRRAIREGRIAEATQMLGRPPLLHGRVVPGEGRGRQLGFPTANLATSNDYVRPDQGIFAGVAFLDERPHPAAIYIGTKPTFLNTAPVIEVHLTQGVFPPLYEATLDVYLIEKVRDDKAFASPGALQTQIQADVEHIHDILTPLPLDKVLD